MFLALTMLLAAAGAQAQSPAPATYAVDASQSEVYWRVYKAGAFSRFGHNHVISAGQLSGSVTRAAALEASHFELVIPVTALVVDDPELRARHGEDFSSEPSAEDIAGTRGNMLGEQVLDAQTHALLRVHGTLAEGPLDAATLDATVEILGRSVPVSIPASIVVTDDRLTASGEFRLEHADLGMEPFNVMMGALAVAEPIDFTYRITAVRVAGTAGAAETLDPAETPGAAETPDAAEPSSRPRELAP